MIRSQGNGQLVAATEQGGIVHYIAWGDEGVATGDAALPGCQN